MSLRFCQSETNIAWLCKRTKYPVKYKIQHLIQIQQKYLLVDAPESSKWNQPTSLSSVLHLGVSANTHGFKPSNHVSTGHCHTRHVIKWHISNQATEQWNFVLLTDFGMKLLIWLRDYSRHELCRSFLRVHTLLVVTRSGNTLFVKSQLTLASDTNVTSFG